MAVAVSMIISGKVGLQKFGWLCLVPRRLSIKRVNIAGQPVPPIASAVAAATDFDLARDADFCHPLSSALLLTCAG